MLYSGIACAHLFNEHLVSIWIHGSMNLDNETYIVHSKSLTLFLQYVQNVIKCVIKIEYLYSLCAYACIVFSFLSFASEGIWTREHSSFYETHLVLIAKSEIGTAVLITLGEMRCRFL